MHYQTISYFCIGFVICDELANCILYCQTVFDFYNSPDEGGAMMRGGQKARILDGFRPFEEILKHFEKKIHQ